MALMWNRTVDWDAEDWRRSAACRNTEPDLFFPVGTTGPAVDQIDAASVCATPATPSSPASTLRWPPTRSPVSGRHIRRERRKLRKAWLAARRSQRVAI